MIKSEFYLFALAFFILFFSYGQNLTDYEFATVKRNQGFITDIIIDERTNEILTSDSEGNILIYSSQDYKYIRSLSLASSKKIGAIRLINNNKDLLINYVNFNEETGNLSFYNFEDDKIYKTIEGDFKITNPNGESLIAVRNNKQDLSLFSKSPFSLIDSLTTDGSILSTTTSFDNFLIANLEQTEINKSNSENDESNIEIKTLRIYDVRRNKQIFNHRFLDPNKIPSAIIFENKSLLCVTSKVGSTFSEIKRINLKTFDFEELGSNQFYTADAETNITSVDRGVIMIFNKPFNGYRKPYKNGVIILELKNGKYQQKFEECSLNNRVGIHNKVNNEYFLLTPEYHEDIEPGISIHDKNFKILNKELVLFKNQINSQSFFISDDYWLSYNLNKGKHIVLTLRSNNSLANMLVEGNDAKEFITSQHSRNFGPETYSLKEKLLDKKSGTIGFRRFEKENSDNNYKNQYIYYSHDLINGETTKVFEFEIIDNSDLYNDLIAFNSVENAFVEHRSGRASKPTKETTITVFSNGHKFNVGKSGRKGVIEPRTLKFSNSGQYLCAYSCDENYNWSFKIYDWKKNKIVFEKKTEGESWKTTAWESIAIGENDFIFNTNQGSFKIEEISNLYSVTDSYENPVYSADFKNKVSIFLNKNGILYNNEFRPIDGLDGARTISLNTDASKLLVNFDNGTSRLLDTKSFKWLNTIVNFKDGKTLIYNTKKKYYSNTDDIDGYLFLRKNNERLSILNDTLNLFDPISILSDFGDIDTEMKTKLNKAVTLRNKFSDETKTGLKIIEDFSVVLNKKPSEYTIEVNLAKDQEPSLQLKVNNVLQKKLKFKKVDSKKYQANIYLTQKINRLELTTETSNGKSKPIIKEVINDSDIERDLYVFTVGVSDYSDKKYKLNYADKDATDISFVYDKIDSNKVVRYLDEHYPASILKKDLNNTVTKLLTNQPSAHLFINHDPYEYANHMPTQVSKDGNYWILPMDSGEMTDYTRTTNVTKLYDFKNNAVKKITFDVPYEHMVNFFKSASNSEGCYFVYEESFEKEEVYYLDFDSGKSIKTDVDFSIQNAFQFNQKEWLEINNLDNPNDSITESFSRKDRLIKKDSLLYALRHLKVNNQWIIKKQPLISKGENISLENAVFTLQDVSYDGKLIVIQEFYEIPDPHIPEFSMYKIRYRLFELDNDFYTEIAFDSNWLDLDSQVWISADKKELYAIQHYGQDANYEREDKTLYNFFTYDLSKKKLITNKRINASNEIHIFGNNYGKPFFLTSSRSGNYEDEYETFKSIVEDLNFLHYQPASFKTEFVKSLINENATSKNIISAAEDFFKDAKPEDQIMLFLAGHGVLDNQLEYYYAPYDMKFNKPEKNGISYSTIIDMLSNSRALQKLLITDTCHSGNTFDIENYDIEEEKEKSGIRGSIAKRTAQKDGEISVSSIINSVFDNFYSNSGVTVLSASSGEEVAYESDIITNGAFTRAYFETMKIPIKNEYYNENDFNEFIKTLNNNLLEITDGKQKMDIKEFNELIKIRFW
ncbi:caspase domain-containing protein [Nonlabens sp. Hel1_33_55]|uniref:caspase family protein n=1 Tax=Nonlabens sp. Hel1_33_55 TaxID=1336802 RepID=UPI000B877F21|nr:caspase family protein [Nonlabens sp. Hel1_33_55]